MGLSATFIREWTDPENVMHSGLCKVRLGAIQTAETSDFNVTRLPPSGSEGSSRVQNEKKRRSNRLLRLDAALQSLTRRTLSARVQA